MKKAIIFLLLFALCLPLGACGKEEPEKIVMFPTAGRNIKAESGSTFSCSDEKVATVDDGGMIIAIAPGTATITVEKNKEKTEYALTVLDPAKYVRLYDCQKITLTETEIKEKMDEVRKSLLDAAATWNNVADAAQKGDRVTVTYSGTVNNQKKDSLSGKNETLIIGDGNFIESFENALVGWKAGSSFLYETTVPSDYTNDTTLKGKKVVFDISISKVERPDYPDFDNAFVKKYTSYDNVNEFDEQEYINAKATLAIAKLVEKSKMIADPPKELYDYYFDQYIKRLETVLYYEYQKKVSGLKEILALLEITEEQLRNSAESQLQASVTQDCVFHAFLYQNGLVMTEEEFAKGTAVYVAENGYSDLDDLLATSGLTLADIREVVLIDYLGLKAADMVKVTKN